MPWREDLAWASGLFEGEGWITSAGASPSGSKYILGLSMTDRDTVERFQRVIGFGSVYVVDKGPGNKVQYRWVVQSFEKVQAALAMLWEGLGARRRARAAAVLAIPGDPRRRR